MRGKRGLALLLCAGMLISAAGCSTQKPKETEQAEAQTYAGKAKGYGGEITVTLQVQDGAILSCTIDAPDETENVGGKYIGQFEEQIAREGKVDAATGATVTSNGVKAALQQALVAAGLAQETTAEMKAGTYTGKAHGFSCIDFVTVDVSVTGSSIERVELVDTFTDEQDSYENRYMCTGAFEVLAPQIVAHQSIGLDAVTGATGSSNGIQSAVRDALEQAYRANGLSQEEAQAAVNSAFTGAGTAKKGDTVALTCDVVVVGAGAAGAVASLAALDAGAEVLNIEKTFRWGGQSMLTGGPKAYSPNTTEAQAQTIFEGYEKTLERHRRGSEDEKWNDPSYRLAHADEYTPANAEAYKAVVPASGLGVETIMDYGVEFSKSTMGLLLSGDMEMPAGPPPASDVPPELLQSEDVYDFGTEGEGASLSYYQAERCYESVYEKFVDKGGKALLSTTVTGLRYGDDGSIIGVTAQADDGTTYEVTAKAVVLATGGYGGNQELMEKWALGGTGWLYYGYQGNTGDGILMALEAGANPYNLEAYPMSHQRMGAQFITANEVQTTPEGQPWSPNDLTVILACNPDGVFVTEDGESFRPEDYDPFNPLGGFAGAMGTYSLGASYYVVYSTEQLEQYAREGITSNAMGFQNVGLGIPLHMPLGDWVDTVMGQAQNQGFAWQVESLEAGDKLLGLAEGTLAKAYQGSGKDTGSSYVVMKCCGLAISSCGGVEVNGRMQAVKADGSVIENLFVAGNDGFGNIMATGAEYPIGGDAGMWVIGSGYLAGENAAELAK